MAEIKVEMSRPRAILVVTCVYISICIDYEYIVKVERLPKLVTHEKMKKILYVDHAKVTTFTPIFPRQPNFRPMCSIRPCLN